jgi:hypothetical protein
MAAELGILQQMLGAAMYTSCLHTSKLTPFGPQCCAVVVVPGEKSIGAVHPRSVR